MKFKWKNIRTAIFHANKLFLFLGLTSCRFSSAMSNPNGLLSQKLCHNLNQGRTLNNILMRAAR